MRYLFLFIFAFQSNAQISDFGTVNFNEADKIALEYKNEKLNNLPELAYKLTANLDTDVERFRAIFMWVCGNIANDYRLFHKNMRKRQRYRDDSLKLKKWNDHFSKIVFKKLLKKNKTLCTGYAYLIKKLSVLANIDCEIVHGFARSSTTNVDRLDTPNHSWNAVKLNSKWYLCDPTWASGIPNLATSKFEFHYNNGFFLSNPKLFAVNHYPADKKWMLLLDEDKPSFKAFIEAPIIYGKAYTNLSVHKEPKKMHNIIQKNESIVFEFQLIKPVEAKDISLLIDNGKSSKKVHPELTSIKNKSLTVEYKFERMGFYDVHFLIGKDLISTYTFRVKG
ncbi:transglutaminase domain-containing protein [Ichthyenterobacterium magnum]|uniref:Transglutaminase superfamily protein n=1 Tax=Ichthyenterobacterium magnum TaxID=1230530 RepID=A0A420DLW9_9FLAO|nr:transglutaminase domain-containing protein [Ichthyenterobacterium magnum]RKE95286.1 transglutaminase superfamily protein [Ichthyenterobacterium magnum]